MPEGGFCHCFDQSCNRKQLLARNECVGTTIHHEIHYWTERSASFVVYFYRQLSRAWNVFSPAPTTVKICNSNKMFSQCISQRFIFYSILKAIFNHGYMFLWQNINYLEQLPKRNGKDYRISVKNLIRNHFSRNSNFAIRLIAIWQTLETTFIVWQHRP